MRWTIGAKIASGFGLALVILAIIGAASYRSTLKQTDTAGWVTHTHQVMESLDQLLIGLVNAETGQRGYFVAGQDQYLEPYHSGVALATQAVASVRDLTKDNPHQQQRLDRFDVLLKQELAAFDEGIDLQKSKGSEASRQWVLTGAGKKDMDEIRNLIAEMRAEETSLLKIRTDDAQASAESTKLIIQIGTLSAFVVLFFAAFLITRNISQPLKEITAAAKRLAAGDLKVTITTNRRRDEVGILVQTFSIMVDNFRRLTSQITEGVNVLGASATQISTSTAQLASSAAETAASVNETTTTVEEVRQTAQVASQKAKYVSDSAQKVTQTAQTGRQSTEATIADIERIRQQMGSVADSMVRLSEQSQAVGQIIATVDDLAAQSNLLAVNAAIEAAKAGEQGKGFSVVAQEVRSLVEQSKQSTNQVRSILGDIQRATSAAVMATEQSSKAVEAGVMQSGQAGQSIQALSSSVSEAAQAATQIAASSQQQLVGVDQVASAMENIKQASSQNMASARQLETSAHSLKELGERLKLLVAQYQM